MSCFSKNDTPAAKVVMRVPTPDSLVEVKVSPPDSNFEVKVAPGEEIIALYIRPGSSSYVEIRITPPAVGASAGKPQVTVIGNLTELPDAEEPLALEAPAGPEPETAAEPVVESPAETPPSWAGRPTPPPDVTSFTEGVFTPIADEAPAGPDGRPAFQKEDSSGIPGPDPALFERPAQAADLSPEDSSGPVFLDPDSTSEFDPAFGAPDGAAMAALARLSAAVENEKEAMASNPGLWAPVEAEAPISPAYEPEDFEDPAPAAEELPAPARNPEASHGRRRMPAADATIMVQMYEDLDTFNPAADTVTPLPEDEEMEIGPMDDELSLGPIEIDSLDESDIITGNRPSGQSGEDRGLPKAKPLSTVVPGNTIIPTEDD